MVKPGGTNQRNSPFESRQSAANRGSRRLCAVAADFFLRETDILVDKSTAARQNRSRCKRRPKISKKLFLMFCWLFCILVVAAFADVVAGTFNGLTPT